MDGSLFLGPLKQFIKSSGDTKKRKIEETYNKNKLEISKATSLSGSDVNQFYRSTVGKKAFESGKTIPKPKTENSVQQKSKTKNTTFNINELMKAVENNNIKLVTSILEPNKDHINCTDQYGWSPLMAACCAGNKQLVEILLQWQPNLELKDKSGNSCKTLAKANKHTDIVQVLDSYMDKIKNPASNECMKRFKEPPEPTYFYCEICKQKIENTSVKKHAVSLLHNFNSQSKRRVPTMYGIPESNKGFQMLMRSGWNKEKGLGPSGEGHKFPPKSVLKQDRTGLGAKQYKARVTHTPEDLRKEAKPRDTYKRQLTTLKQKEQRQERHLRRMLT